MSPLLYFHDGQNSPHRIRTALSYAFSRPPVARQCLTGPAGVAGIVVAETESVGQVAFHPDTQVWHQMPASDAGGLWFGWYRDEPPTPAALQRSNLLPGHEIQLAGQTWSIPIAKRMHMPSSDAAGSPRIAAALPAQLTWDGAAFSRGPVVDRYRRLWEISEMIFDRWRSSQDGNIRLPENSEMLCCEVLGVNYRLGPAEVCALGLIEDDPNQLWSILRLVIDEPTILDWFKKKLSASAGDSANMSPGDRVASI